MASIQADRILNFTSTLGSDVLLPEFLAGVEGISELFYYQVELVADVNTSIDPKSIIGTKVTVGILADDSGTERYINGIVASFEFCGGDDEYNNYRAYIVPNIWLLTLNLNTRVFQNKTVTDVIQSVLSPYNISPSIQTSGTYTPMEYCTQYRETDFAFISRLMEQHGIFYYFQHAKDDHTFTLQDTSTKLSACPIQNSFMYSPEGDKSAGFYDFVISTLRSRTGMVTGKYTAWDYSFIRYKTLPDPLASTQTAGPLGANSNEQYDYADSAGSYLKGAGSDSTIADLSNFFQTMRRDAGDAECVVIEGISNAIAMQTGFNFTLTEYPQSAVNTKYLLTRIEHSVRQSPPYRARGTTNTPPYSNSFTAIPFATLYRPPRRTHKPVVNGMQTGQVVVPSGEDSHMDKYGRVNVQFFWDRLRKANTPDNTWLRVAQSWAGKGWGTYYWPRVDDEVLIDFIEGDPDQPIVVGSVYNGVNMPKYDPAGQYTLSGILTRSSKGGGAANANELRFEDLDGKEQVFMNAERDYDLHVEHDHHTLIGNEQHEKITSNHFMETDGDSHSLVKGKRNEEIDGDLSQTLKGNHTIKLSSNHGEDIGSNSAIKIGANSDTSVGANLTEKVGANYSLDVGVNENHKIGMMYNIDSGMMINIKAGMSIVIDAPMGVSLTCGGNFVNLTPAGVMIQGILVNINSGGAAMSAQSASTQSPQSPTSPTAPTAPTFPGDAPPSQAATAAAGSSTTTPKATTGSASSSPASSTPPAAPPAAAAAAAASYAAQQATQQAAQAAQSAANDAQQFAQAAQTAANQAQQQAQQAVNQVTQEARAAYGQANQAVQAAQQQVSQAAAQGQAAAQQALNQAQAAAQQTAQQAAAAVQQAQQQAQQVEQQAQAAAQQAQQQAQQAEQQAQQAAQAAEKQAQAAAQQAQQQASQAVQQGQQAAQQAQQQAQQAAQQAQAAAKQAQAAAQQAQQQAQQAASQVQGAASQATQQAQQAANQAQQSAQQAIGQAMKGF
ncbi:type VI secretion system Vgr family protein [Alloacidobacterium sp.]|uniref:type VI secretion system Vgr family protein n=1 Tax=Alloacidobacterium sp. TaxID=2951999 RepID=UPI002D3865F1|nr:type VI secretion system tip protein TssI/VgrG [Alloacidobacterium sp.]HYK35013.1 type VI secretion system tip protein TssI/VgrG [Alloacidobacterium sp.]